MAVLVAGEWVHRTRVGRPLTALVARQRCRAAVADVRRGRMAQKRTTGHQHQLDNRTGVLELHDRNGHFQSRQTSCFEVNFSHTFAITSPISVINLPRWE